MEVLALQFAGGMLKMVFLFLPAAGLTLIFGVTRVLNLAHGSFYMLGAYMTFTIMGFLGSNPLAFWVALILAPLMVAALGGLVEIALLRRVYGAGIMFVALLTFSLILIIGEGVRIIWGTSLVNVPRPAGLGGSVAIGSRFLPTYSLLLLGVGAAIGILLWVVVFRTRLGLLLRAAALDREMLSCLGINVPRLFTLTFVLGTWLVGIAGALAAPMVVLEPSMDASMIIETFSVVVIGGLGSIGGSVLSSLMIGQFLSFGILAWSDIALPLIFILMTIVLIVRPSGLFGRQDI